MTAADCSPSTPPPPHSDVAAVIVTFNRLQKLPKTLASVQAQSHPPRWIVVVNNNSTDGTKEYLESLTLPNLVLVHLPENIGGAGGFEVGMERGYQLGADFLWLMDEDCYPEEAALKLLLAERDTTSQALGYEVPFACSIVKFINGELCEMNNPATTWDWPRALLKGSQSVLVGECTFVSVLVPRHVLAEVGLPLREYFIWYDDKEFTKRIARHYGPGIVVLGSTVVHDMGVNAGVNYRQVTAENVWKFEKGARNQSSYRRHYEGRLSYIAYVYRVLREMHAGRVATQERRRMIRALWAGRSFNPQPRFPGARPA